MADTKGGLAVAEPQGKMADYLKTLPPIPEDPNTYWDEERDVQIPADQERDPNVDAFVAEGEDLVETPEGATETRERDEHGRFVKKPGETVEGADVAPAEAVSTTDTATPDTAPAPKTLDEFLASLEENDRQAFEFSRKLAAHEDPVGFLAEQANSAGLRAAMLEKLGVPAEVIAEMDDPAAKAGVDPDYEPIGYERVLTPHLDKLARFPEAVGEIATPIVMEAVNQHFDGLAPYMDAANIDAQVNAVLLDAVFDAIGIPKPEINRAEMMKALQADKDATYHGVVQAHLAEKIKTAVGDYKQAVKARPTTPGSDTPAVSINDLPRDRADGYGLVDAKEIYRQVFGGG